MNQQILFGTHKHKACSDIILGKSIFFAVLLFVRAASGNSDLNNAEKEDDVPNIKKRLQNGVDSFSFSLLTYPHQPHEFSSSKDRLFVHHRSPSSPNHHRPNPYRPSRCLASPFHLAIDLILIYPHHRRVDHPVNMNKI